MKKEYKHYAYRILFSLAFIFGVPPHICAGSVTTGENGRSWTLRTNSSVYQIMVDDNGEVRQMYFGDAARGDAMAGKSFGHEVTVRGGYSSARPMVEVVFSDRVRDIELEFVSAEIISVEGFETLAIKQKDNFYPLEITSFIRILPEYGLYEKWIELKNTSTDKKSNIKIENALSGTFSLPRNDYSLTHYSGSWACELQEQTTVLTQGTKTLEVRDFKSFGSSFFGIRPAGESSEASGEVWFGSLRYSGNWKIDVTKYAKSEEAIDRTATGNVQISGGINFWDQELYLKQGEKFVTPKMVIGYSREGMQGVSRSLGSYIRETVLPASHRGKIRPVIYNSWFVTGFNVNEENQVELARIAKEMGVETFVVDDGWFRGRVDGHSGMGDWTVDSTKFPDGLQPMIAKINEMGLDFGIWVEPEMVSFNSELYRKHPDWIFHFPNRSRHHGHRKQYMLNLAREDVYHYLFNSLATLLRENNISYLKIDVNQALSDPGSPSIHTDEQREVRIKYIDNLYRLIDNLRQEFPDVWFESCSGGGGRTDIEMLAHMDFNWTSDNTDPVDRTFMQYSYLNLFPANTMLNLVCDGDWHGVYQRLDFKFDVSMCGLLGIGGNIKRWSEAERQLAKDKIQQYKQLRETVQFGELYRLVSPYHSNRSVLQFVGKDLKESVVFVYNLQDTPVNAVEITRKTNNVKLKGLQDDSAYTVEGFDGYFTGDYLMNVGLTFPVRGTYRSGIFKIKEHLLPN